MGWYRVYQGLPYDARLGVVARRSGLTRAETIALYIFLFDTASRGAAGGCVSKLDPEEAGIALDIDAAKVAAALGAMREKGLVNDAGCLADWDMQVPPSTLRVRAYRKRKLEQADPDSPAEARDRRSRLGNDGGDSNSAKRNTKAGESRT